MPLLPVSRITAIYKWGPRRCTANPSKPSQCRRDAGSHGHDCCGRSKGQCSTTPCLSKSSCRQRRSGSHRRATSSRAHALPSPVGALGTVAATVQRAVASCGVNSLSSPVSAKGTVAATALRAVASSEVHASPSPVVAKFNSIRDFDVVPDSPNLNG
jgi:hypothetical protein